jgi:SNF2 family DNA or RNA helicase
MVINNSTRWKVTSEVLEQAADMARAGATRRARERAFVGRVVSLTIRDAIEAEFGISTTDGRSGDLRFTELLDVNDFKAGEASVEVRATTVVEEEGLYVPTLPLVVGFVSNIYIAAKTNANLSEIEVLGFAEVAQLEEASLSKNGLMAYLPSDELQPWARLPESLSVPHSRNDEEKRNYAKWQARASKITRSLQHALGADDAFKYEHVERLVGALHDEIFRIYGENAPPIGIEGIYNKLADKFNLPTPIRTHPESPLVFSNPRREEEKAAAPDTSRRFFEEELGVGIRANLYRHLIQADEQFDSHRRLSAALDAATEGKLHASPRRKTQIANTKQILTEAADEIEIPPPITDPLEKKELDDWFAEFESTQSPIPEASAENMIDNLKPGTIITGPFFPEPVQVIAVVPMGASFKIYAKGLETKITHEPILTIEQLALLTLTTDVPTYDGDALKFRLGIESMRLGLAYEYDPFFALSVARVDPLPHQLEAVYDYFMKLPRIRFLLADDPGAGKTIMAGLLIKELKLRGLIKRVLIITPAALSFQWQREMKDKFRENFDVVRGDVLRANYGSNPFQDKDQVVTSISWVSVIDAARSSLLRSDWDLIIVDEAHKLSAYSSDKKTYAYRLGEELFERTDHLLLMTATPHKGDPENFRLFLELLDKDVYGDIKSLREAMARKEAPFYLRRTKEALVTFPNPETGKSEKIFTKREVKTTTFQIDLDEADLYENLTRYVEDQSIKAAQLETARGRVLGFTMAMLQRRFASSIYALRRSLQRMQDKRQAILDDPEKYRQEQMDKKKPEDFDDLPDLEQARIIEELEGVVASVDPAALRQEIQELGGLIGSGIELEKREVESKLSHLKNELVRTRIFDDPNTKLLIFTEHKDTLDYLVEKLRGWGLSVAQIHGGMHVGDRDTPGTRIYAEREFKESAQVMVATEAAGEGINLQFCWFMINYDLPWNPMRLEQRMGRIHRYGQTKDCLILNFVSTSTREGRVLDKLLSKLGEISSELGTDHVFDVIGEMLPSNMVEQMFRKMYQRNLTEAAVTERIVHEVDIEKIRQISESTLEGLAKRSLNISALTQRRAEAKERRLVPEVIEDFFLSAAPITGLQPKEIPGKKNTYRVGRVPRNILAVGDQLEGQFGKLGREFKQIVFSKKAADDDSKSEWVTPGHPLFESVRVDINRQVKKDLQRGSILYDLNANEPYRLDTLTAAVKDGLGNVVHRRLFVVKSDMSGKQELREPTLFLDLALSEKNAALPPNLQDAGIPDRSASEGFLYSEALKPLLAEVQAERERELTNVLRHIEMSLTELISRQTIKHMDLLAQHQMGETQLVAANLKTVEDRLHELNNRLDRRKQEILNERHCSIGDIHFVGSTWVLPHPDKNKPDIAPMVRDDEIERRAVAFVTAHEESQGRVVETVESQNRGFDLVSRLPHPEDPMTAMDVRFIEVKGRSAVGEIALTTNEYKTAVRLKEDYWLYVVFGCGGDSPNLQVVRDPARLAWEPLTKIEHYHVGADAIQKAGATEI